jgi:hypothetical protein
VLLSLKRKEKTMKELVTESLFFIFFILPPAVYFLRQQQIMDQKIGAICLEGPGPENELFYS